MPGFKVLATNHTSFTVSDLDRSLAFFRDGLGFDVTSKAPRDPGLSQAVTGVEGAALIVAYVRGPGHSLELIQYDSPVDKGKVISRPCDTGFAHVAYDVDNIDAAITTAANYEVLPVGKVTVIDKGPNAGMARAACSAGWSSAISRRTSRFGTSPCVRMAPSQGWTSPMTRRAITFTSWHKRRSERIE